MTENEAIKELSYDETAYGGKCSAQVRRVAIHALAEVQQYRSIEHRLEDMFGGKMFLKDYVDKLEWTIEETAERLTPKKPIGIDRCTCPSCGTHNEVIKKRRNTVVCDTVYCWHCGQAIECQRDIDLG